MSGSAFGRVQVSLKNNWGFFLTGGRHAIVISEDICIESCWQLINMGSGWSAPIQVTLCPIDSCYSLNRGIRHLERSFHLSSTQGGLSPPLTTLGDYQPLERIITSHYPGGLSAPREDYHHSLTWGLSPPTEDYPLSQSWEIITPKRGLSPLPL